jgi:histidine triad (HIT) family protein
MADECVFCRIIRKEVPSQPIHEDHDLIAFPDINPVAPVHVLVVPKEHMVNLNEARLQDRQRDGGGGIRVPGGDQ